MLRIGLEFEWEVPQEGLRWVDRGQEEGSGSTFTLGMVLGKEVDARPPWLIGPPVGGKVPTTSRHPLEEFPGLHREFAQLPIQRKAVLEFAQRYGPLTKGLVLVEERGEGHFATYRAEPWHFWLREIQDMKDALYLLDLLRGHGKSKPHEEDLREAIIWREGGVYFLPWQGELRSLYFDLLGYRESASERVQELRPAGGGDLKRLGETEEIAEKLGRRISRHLEQEGRFSLSPRLIACSTLYPEKFHIWKKTKDVVGPAWFMLGQMVTEKLKGKVDLKLLGNQDEIGLVLVPQDLLSALWLGLLFEILGRIRLKRCPICGTFFDASPAPQQVFCDRHGTGCRQRAYRWRRKLKALLKEGKTLEEAARKVGIDATLASFLLRTARGK